MPMPQNPPSFFTPGQFAKLYGVTPRTVRNWCDAGRIPFVTTPSGHRRIPVSVLTGGVENLDTWGAMIEQQLGQPG